MENLCCKFAEMNKEDNVRHPSGRSKAKVLWKMRDAKGRGDEYHDQASVVLGRSASCDTFKHLQEMILNVQNIRHTRKIRLSESSAGDTAFLLRTSLATSSCVA